METRPSRDGASFVLSVSDTGVGIPQHELPHIFERFHRIENMRGRSIEGSGIGLALVHELVRLHGGEIRVQSRVEVGSVFSVRIPFAEEANLPVEPLTSRSTGSQRAQAYIDEALGWLEPRDVLFQQDNVEIPGGVVAVDPVVTPDVTRERILVADDNADMRNYLARLLSSAGYRISAVGDGLQALDLARREFPDLIVSDVMMPGLDGFAVLAALRADERLRNTPILLLSARAGEESKVEGLAAGADDYLTKPFSARELVAQFEPC